MTQNSFLSKASHLKLLGLLTIIGYIYLMSFNHLLSLTNPDEVFYTQSAKEMIKHDSWMTPYIFDQPQFEKPIFFFWLLVAALKVFGLSSFAARFWPAVFGIAMVLLTYWLAWMLFRSKRTAFLSAIVICSSFMHLAMSRAVLTDMVFSFWVVLALAFFYWAYTQPRFRFQGIFGCWIISGIAVLTKGILGFLFPAAIILSFLIYKREFSFLKNSAWGLGGILFLVIVLPWHILMYQLYGARFIDEYFQNVHLRRIFEAEHQKSNTWYFYLGTMVGGMFPWSLFLFPVIGRLFLRNKPAENQQQMIFLCLWIFLTFLIMQSAQSKLASYILAVFPALAILIGSYLNQTLERWADQRRIKSLDVGLAMIGIVVGAASVGAILAGRTYTEVVPDMMPIYIFSLLGLLIAIGIFILTAKLKYLPAIFMVSSIAILVMVVSILGHSYAEPWVSCKLISDELNRVDHSKTRVLASKFYARGVRYYTNREMAVLDINGKGFFSAHPIPFLNSDQQVLKFLESQPVTFCVVKKSGQKDLERIAAQGGFTIESLAGVGGKYIFKIQKKPVASRPQISRQ